MLHSPSLLLLVTLLSSPYSLAAERWLVELEHYDGVRLQFQGAELEQGSAVREGDDPELRPGLWLAIDSQHGVALRIRSLGTGWSVADRLGWRRAQDRLLARQGDTLSMARLGDIFLAPDVRLINGLFADLQPGRELVLSRDDAGPSDRDPDPQPGG